MNITLRNLMIQSAELMFCGDMALPITEIADYGKATFDLSRSDWDRIVKCDHIHQFLLGNARMFCCDRKNFFSLRVSMSTEAFDQFSLMLDPEHVEPFIGRS